MFSASVDRPEVLMINEDAGDRRAGGAATRGSPNARRGARPTGLRGGGGDAGNLAKTVYNGSAKLPKTG